jgi:hypothetical protein
MVAGWRRTHTVTVIDLPTVQVPFALRRPKKPGVTLPLTNQLATSPKPDNVHLYEPPPASQISVRWTRVERAAWAGVAVTDPAAVNVATAVTPTTNCETLLNKPPVTLCRLARVPVRPSDVTARVMGQSNTSTSCGEACVRLAAFDGTDPAFWLSCSRPSVPAGISPNGDGTQRAVRDP